MPLSDTQPHLVMVVASAIQGDSRVIKSARTAAAAGYRVTVVGRLRNNTMQYENDGRVTYYRIPFDLRRHGLWLADRQGGIIERLELTQAQLDRARLGIIDAHAGRNALTRGKGPLRAATHRLRRLVQRLAPRARRVTTPMRSLVDRSRDASLSLLGRTPGSWRRLAPVTLDFQEMYFDALMGLKPDLIHVHDYHPIAAADLYSAFMASRGRHVPWVYDAHEWVPGTHFPDPHEHAAYVAMEAEAIQRANAVITVTDEIAWNLRRQHRLGSTPKTVTNAPTFRQHPAPGRRPLREECGLGPDVPLLVYVGGIAERRGLLTCVGALQYLPDAHVAFVANNAPEQRARLIGRATELGVSDRVHLFDYVPAESVTWYVASADIGISALLGAIPQHHLAMPTKLREYLFAGLPVLVSNMRTQEEWVRRWKVGEVFQEGDAVDLATRFNEMLAHRERYVAAINAEFMRANSWESQEKVLTGVWANLVPPAASATEAECNPGLRMVATSSATSWVIYDTWGKVTGDTIAREVIPTPKIETLGQRMQRWRRWTTPSLVLVIAGNTPTLTDTFETDVRTLQNAGTTVVGVAEAGSCEHLPTVATLVPTHPLLAADPDTLARHEIQVRDMAKRLSGTVTTLTPSRLTASMHLSLQWLPVPVETAQARTEPTRRVLVLSAWRSQAERDAMDHLEAVATEAGYTLEHATAATLANAVLRGHDVVIDALNTGEYSPAAAHAMGQGCVVMGGASRFGVDAPVVEADNDSVATVLRDLLVELQDPDALVRRSSASIEFVRKAHAPRHTVDILRRIRATQQS